MLGFGWLSGGLRGVENDRRPAQETKMAGPLIKMGGSEGATAIAVARPYCDLRLVGAGLEEPYKERCDQDSGSSGFILAPCFVEVCKRVHKVHVRQIMSRKRILMHAEKNVRFGS